MVDHIQSFTKLVNREQFEVANHLHSILIHFKLILQKNTLNIFLLTGTLCSRTCYDSSERQVHLPKESFLGEQRNTDSPVSVPKGQR